MTLLKLSSPTHVGACTRFVCWNAMTTVRTIGYHENAPKTSSSGSRKSERREPAAADPGERRAPRRGRRRVGESGPFDFDLADRVPSRLRVTVAGGGRPGAAADRSCTLELAAARDRLLRLAVRLLQQRLDVGVLVRQHRLDDGVEGVVDALGRRLRLGDQRLVEDPVVNGFICAIGTLM